ncbi:nicotinate-nucleotide adenylyltransferase [Mycoplasma sp. 394]
MKIGIYGGSFDPIHIGHIKLAKYAIKELNLDKLLFVPTFTSPFKSKTKLVKPYQKAEMIQLVLEEKMQLCDFEIKRNNVSYTIDTVKYLRQKYPNDQLFLLIGSDNLPKLNKWKDIDIISQLTQITVFRRDKNINKINLKKYNGILLNNPFYDFASSDFKNGMLSHVDKKVLNYIQKDGLYLEQIIHNSLSALRAKHSVATADFAVKLAKAHNYPAKDAYIAGLTHDIAKEWDVKRSLQAIKEFEPDIKEENPAFLHQICSYIWLKHGYMLQNQAILQAVRYHTQLHPNMSKLDKIIFVADKICQGRRFTGIQKIRDLALTNLDAGFKEVVKQTYDFNISKGVKFSNESLNLYNLYMKD